MFQITLPEIRYCLTCNISKSLLYYVLQHSKLLSKVHDEVYPRLKKIRQRLNNLLIERSPVKVKAPRIQSGSQNITPKENPCTIGLGGKAGKSHFNIQVGEVSNLYKTSKASHYTLGSLPTLDLHGYSSEEALKKLDYSLKVWVEMAMHESYPFILQAEIVCGCGSQTLSEVVDTWIRSNKDVCNAPKNRRGR